VFFRGPHQLICTALFLSAYGLASAATITVDPVVSFSSGQYQYSYTITNPTPDDSFLIDIPVPADPAAIDDITVPAGFESAFDSGLGLVSFLEDTLMFGPTPTAGFSFDSPIGPGAVLFTATLVSSVDGSLYTLSGPTTAPAVPEPATFPLVAAAGLGLVSLGRKSKR
jgi:hypothetical protein